MSTTVFPFMPLQYLDASGNPVSGGTLYFYVAGTVATPQVVSSDITGTPTYTSITLDSAGRPSVSGTLINIYPIAASYKVVLKDASGTPLWSLDNIPAAAAAASLGSVTSVGLTMPSGFTVANSPVTSAGTLAVTTTPNYAAGICQGRLTLTSGTPVTTGDVTGATSVYFTPFRGNEIDLFDGTSVWNRRKFTELTLALGTLTAALPYDVFIYDNAGTPALRSPVAWTNTTTRATALATQDGIYVKTGATTDRYLGTFLTTATTTTEDSVTKRDLWNYYNRFRRPLRVVESTSSWAGANNSTVRQLNASAANQVEVVVGVNEEPVWVAINALGSATAGGIAIAIGVGVDSTTTFQAGIGGGTVTSVANGFTPMTGVGWLSIAVGRHLIQVLEETQTAGTATLYGSSNGSVFATSYQPGLEGWIKG